MNIAPVTPLHCPYCGSANIGIKEHVFVTQWKTTAKQVYAYCRMCHRKGHPVLCDSNASEAEEIYEAFEAWNKHVQQTQLRQELLKKSHENKRKH